MSTFHIEVLAEDAPVVAAQFKKIRSSLASLKHFAYSNAPEFGRVEVCIDKTLPQMEEWLMQNPGIPDFFEVKEA